MDSPQDTSSSIIDEVVDGNIIRPSLILLFFKGPLFRLGTGMTLEFQLTSGMVPWNAQPEMPYDLHQMSSSRTNIYLNSIHSAAVRELNGLLTVEVKTSSPQGLLGPFIYEQPCGCVLICFSFFFLFIVFYTCYFIIFSFFFSFLSVFSSSYFRSILFIIIIFFINFYFIIIIFYCI